VDWINDTIVCQLHTSTYVPNQDTDEFQSDLTNEVSGTGYTTGGVTLGSKTATYTGGTNTIALDAADATWASSTITARVAVVIDTQSGSSSTNPLILYQLSSVDVSTTSGTFTVQWSASGLVNDVVA
jgi:hypothetical protein